MKRLYESPTIEQVGGDDTVAPTLTAFLYAVAIAIAVGFFVASLYGYIAAFSEQWVMMQKPKPKQS